MQSITKFERPLNILIAEDNDINRFIIEKMLREWGLNPDFAKTGTQAVEMCSKKQFDLILMDVEMPDMNGYRATEIIRAELDAPANEIPIVAMTGHAMKGEREKCLKVGMNDYLSKPFKPEELREKIIQLTKSKDAIEAEIKEEFTGDLSDVTISSSLTNNNSPAAKTEPGERLTSLQFLKEISENNEQFFKEFIQMFLTNTPKSITDMNDACNTKDWEKLRQAAHKAKPSFNYVGLKEMNQLAAKIEEYAKSQQHLDEIPAMLKRITDVSALAFLELEAELNSISTN